MFSILLLLLSVQAGFSQIAINTSGASADPSAMLDVNATDKGLLIPRVSLNSLSDSLLPVNNPATGLIVYNTGENMTPGIYMWNGQKWASLVNLGIFGEMFEYHCSGSYSNLYIPCSGTYVQWTTATEGDDSGVSFASSGLIIENEGMYGVAFNTVVQLPYSGKTVDIALFVNGNRQDDLHSRAWFKEGGKTQNISFSGIIGLAGDDVVTVRYTKNDDGTIRVEIANLSLTKID